MGLSNGFMNLSDKELAASAKRVKKSRERHERLPFAKCHRCDNISSHSRTDVYFVCSECNAIEKVEMALKPQTPDTGPTFGEIEADHQAETSW